MSAPQSLLQAAVNRLAARLGSGLAESAASLAVLAQDAPARLQQELSLFWEEVELEAERLERGEGAPASAAAQQRTASQQRGSSWGEPAGRDPQEQIDALRARVAELGRRLEQPPR
jgi:hypothetical protein